MKIVTFTKKLDKDNQLSLSNKMSFPELLIPDFPESWHPARKALIEIRQTFVARYINERISIESLLSRRTATYGEVCLDCLCRKSSMGVKGKNKKITESETVYLCPS